MYFIGISGTGYFSTNIGLYILSSSFQVPYDGVGRPAAVPCERSEEEPVSRPPRTLLNTLYEEELSVTQHH